MIKFVLIFFIGVIATSCSTGNKMAQDEVTKRFRFVEISDSAYWRKVNPVAFLDTLQNYGKYTLVAIATPPDSNWITEKDVQELEKKIHSNENAAIVFSYYENNAHSGRFVSTVGIQARYLIEGFKKKQYPPTLCSYHYFDAK